MPGVRMVSVTSSPERRGLVVGVYVSAFYLGSAASLFATGLLLSGLGWRGAALALGIVSMVALSLGLWGVGRSPPPSLPEAVGGHTYLYPAVLRNGAVMRNILILAYTGHSWELYVSRGWLAAFLAAVLATQGLGSVEAAAEGGKWAALMAGLGTVGVWLGGWLSDRWGRARAALAIAAASGVISLGFGWLGAAGWWLLV